MLRIELPWPDKALKQNGQHGHWATVSRARRTARNNAYWLTRAAMGAQLGATTTSINHDGASDIILRQVAHPPDKRARDRDGIDAALKSHRDGIADALRVDDKFFRPTGIEWGEPVAGGRIVVEVQL